MAYCWLYSSMAETFTFIILLGTVLLLKHDFNETIENLPSEMVDLQLTHFSLVPHICISESGRHWLR